MCLVKHQRPRGTLMVMPTSSDKVMSTSSDMDKISKLPDDILLDVLLSLDLTQAAQTSVLAKRWRYLWTCRTDLNFHPENTNFKKKHTLLARPAGPPEYVNWVSQVLDAHRAPCITKSRFFFRHSQPTCNDEIHVEKWVRFALSKGVTDLELDLFSTPKSTNFSLGFDILNNFSYLNLKSLRLSHVDISGEALEFILSHCRLLEVLYVRRSRTLNTLNIVSDKLKHLTLMTYVWLKELRIDAVNLISFRYDKLSFDDPSPHIVLNRVTKLVDMSLEGDSCRYPFPVLGQLSCLFNQLTRLSFHPIDAKIRNRTVLVSSSDVRLEFDMLFPNAKHLTLTFCGLSTEAIIFVKFFINACPVLHELKLQVPHGYGDLEKEAKQLQEVELENEIIDDMSNDGNPYSQAQEEKVINFVFGEENGRNKTCSNLKALEFVGFQGYNRDVKVILDTIADAKCVQTVICDTRSFDKIGTYWERKADLVARTKEIRRRARKLCKLLSRGVRVGVRDTNGLFWVSQN